MKKYLNYNVGLDIGTTSVGYAITDDYYNLLKKGRNHLWGSSLFDAADPAKDRRLSRSTRRRYNKRRQRIVLLRSLLEKMVLNVDPTFFIRLEKVSFLDEEDKKEKLDELGEEYLGNYNLFCDADFNDKDYYSQFPTIYHLRKYLCETDEKVDPRLIYLALHHIIKYRGNFLYEGKTFDLNSENIVDDLKSLLEEFYEINQITEPVSDDNIDKVIEILLSKKARSDRAKDIKNVLGYKDVVQKSFDNLFKSFLGLAFDCNVLFINEEMKGEDGKSIKLKFAEKDYESKYEDNSAYLDRFEGIVKKMYKIYSWVELNGVLFKNDESDEISISKSMVLSYEKHGRDLKRLKNDVRKYCPEKYNEIFRCEKTTKNNYYNYINHPTKTTLDAFYVYLKTIIVEFESDEKQHIEKDIEAETFLLKQNSNRYGCIPYQLNRDEFEKIIDKQSKYYPELKENKDKFLSLLGFKVPYYVGPLNGDKSSFGWLIKKNGKENERILPWNYEEVIDLDETAKVFIERLTNYCTYLPTESVMPKNSLICKLYEVLTEVNKIRVNGELIDSEVKCHLIETLFMKKKTITEKDLIDWLYKEQIIHDKELVEISGYQKDKQFASNLSSWIDFKRIFGEFQDVHLLEIDGTLKSKNVQMIENIIFDLTVFNERSIIKRRLKKIYKLDSKQIQQILNLNYTGWSHLSKKLVYGIRKDNKYGSSCTILEVMVFSNKNLMQIIRDEKLNYKKAIEDANFIEKEGKFTYEDVVNLHCSPSVKKGIWHSLKLLNEITKFMGQQPSNVYIEFARNEGEKKRTDSRFKSLDKKYKNCDKKDGFYDEKVVVSLKKFKDNNERINDRLFLYFKQMGKCMYTQEPLEIDDLDKYQIDHIYPQSLIRDNSIDNRVLVKSIENQRKLDDLTVPASIQNRMINFWRYLKDNKLISETKYYRLTRRVFSESAIDNFINRQLVETRQITKNVANIIDGHYQDTKVVSIHADLSHDFRMKYDLYKNRNVNDFHHAQDAYIASILGFYIKKKYPHLDAKNENINFLKYLKSGKLKRNKGHGYILDSMNQESFDSETGELIWDPSFINKIKKCFYYKDCYVTKKLETNDSELFKATVHPNDNKSPKGKTEAKVPLNKYRKDVHKYGGLKDVTYNIFAIEGVKGREEIRQLVNIPVYLAKQKELKKIEYVEQQYGYKNVSIIKEIRKNQLIEINGGMYYISSASEIVNAKQLILNEEQMKTISLLNSNKFDEISDEEFNDIYETIILKIENYYPKYINFAIKLKDKVEVYKNFNNEKKKNVIIQLLLMLSVGSSRGKLDDKEFKIGSSLGRMNSVTLNLDDITFYDVSISGIYVRKYKL